MKKGKDSFYAKYIKRILDFTLSLIALIVLSPLLLILTITGAIAMKGNPFFVQKRPGKIDPKTGKERIFSLIKFRTMDNRRDEEGNLLPSEKRLTAYGRFLRKTSLDEIVQILNVLYGDMAIIGPRPLLTKYLTLYSDEQHHRHDVLPGITGYAQAVGRNALSWKEKFVLDLQYVSNVSFALDVKIVFMTIDAVLKHKNVEGSNAAIVEEFRGKTKEEAKVE